MTNGLEYMSENKVRRANISYLSDKGIEVDVELPFIDSDTNLRNIEEIGQRINILHMLYAVSLEGSSSIKFFNNLIQKENWSPYLTSQEEAFFKAGVLRNKEKIQFSWVKEAIFALLWSCKVVDDPMIKKFEEIDISDYYQDIPPEKNYNAFIQSLSLRRREEVYAVLDLYYNLHWYAKKTDREGGGFLRMLRKKSTSLNLSVVTERRKALEWVLDADLDWDHVPLDT